MNNPRIIVFQIPERFNQINVPHKMSYTYAPVFTSKNINTKKAFQLKTNHPLPNRCMGSIGDASESESEVQPYPVVEVD